MNLRAGIALLVALLVTSEILPARAAPGGGASNLAVGESFVVVPPTAEYVAKLDPRERDEQSRDWAVLATVARLTSSSTQAASATYELPPARLPYMDQLYELEHGRSRRVYLGKRVLFFRDLDDPDPQATLGRLADRARMENGELPARLELYLIDDRRDDGEIVVARAPDLKARELFSPAFGYVEANVSNFEQLGAWLGRVDDVSFARISPRGGLLLGGRRFAKTRTENVTAEDVAALYQAHLQLGGAEDLDRRGMRSPGFSLDPQWLPGQRDPTRLWLAESVERLAKDPCSELRAIIKSAEDFARKEPDLSRRTARARAAIVLKESLFAAGFTEVFPRLCQQLNQASDRWLSALSTQLNDTAVGEQGGAITSFYETQAALESQSADTEEGTMALVLSRILDFYQLDSQVQCARYEGLSGTEAGMTLFYTDLLAKLWQGVDYGLSAPLLEVPGFLSIPQLQVPAEFEARDRLLPHTRIWFGPRSSAISRVDSSRGTSVAFGAFFSRIFAAGSNPTSPGVEESSNEASRRTIGWWDRHFDSIARYEPKFHRLNQIMKWSSITAILLDKSAGRYLESAAVRRDLTFAAWSKDHAAVLRFSEALPAPHATLAGRECIPLLSSYFFEHYGSSSGIIFGGVGSVSRAASRYLPTLQPSKALGARKLAPLDPIFSGSAASVRRLPIVEQSRVAFSNASSDLLLSNGRAPIALNAPRVEYFTGDAPRRLLIRARTASGELGSLSASGTGGRMTLAWEEAGAKAASTRIDRTTVGLQKLKDELRAATSGEREALARAVGQDSPHLAELIRTRQPLPDLVVDNGRLATQRDLGSEALANAKTVTPSDFAGTPVYIDSRINVAREGVLPGLGGHASRWRRVKDVRIQEVRASEIGELSDRFRLPSGETLIHSAAQKEGIPFVQHPSPTVLLIRQCQRGEGKQNAAKTSSTGDDC
jgi:hypothetical protein